MFKIGQTNSEINMMQKSQSEQYLYSEINKRGQNILLIINFFQQNKKSNIQLEQMSITRKMFTT